MILGIDPGTVRIGVAVADPETRFARPLEVIEVAKADPVARVTALVDELGATLVVVGEPTSLSGQSGRAAEAQSDFVERLGTALAVPVMVHDERLTTVIAEQGLRAAGARARARKRRVDAVAAQVMLQGFLDAGGDLR